MESCVVALKGSVEVAKEELKRRCMTRPTRLTDYTRTSLQRASLCRKLKEFEKLVTPINAKRQRANVCNEMMDWMLRDIRYSAFY